MAKNNDKDLMESGAKVKLGTSDKVIRGFGYAFVSFYAVCCIIPFLIIVSSSFTSEAVIRAEGVQLIPKDITLEAYKMVTKSGGIWKSYILTIVMTLAGTGVGLSIISMTGYTLQRKDFFFRNAISFYIYFTSLFSAGLITKFLLSQKGRLLFYQTLPYLSSPFFNIYQLPIFIVFIAIAHSLIVSGIRICK